MPGNKRIGIVLQPRDRKLLDELGRMRIIDRETAKVIVGFSSTTRANVRLLELTRAGLLRRFFVGSVGSGRKAIYTLALKGAQLVQAPFDGIRRLSGGLLVGDRFVEHQSAVNHIYLAVKYRPAPEGRLLRWIIFRAPISEVIKLTPDGYFELESGPVVRAMFLEVDLATEALAIWQQKIASYLQLAISGEFQKLFHQEQFRVLVVGSSERRINNIRAVVAKQTNKIFWFTTLNSVQRSGFWSSIWLRPSGDQRLALL